MGEMNEIITERVQLFIIEIYQKTFPYPYFPFSLARSLACFLSFQFIAESESLTFHF
jgi:hypothetical protein